jgi:hypothetical protein
MKDDAPLERLLRFVNLPMGSMDGRTETAAMGFKIQTEEADTIIPVRLKNMKACNRAL